MSLLMDISCKQRRNWIFTSFVDTTTKERCRLLISAASGVVAAAAADPIFRPTPHVSTGLAVCSTSTHPDSSSVSCAKQLNSYRLLNSQFCIVWLGYTCTPPGLGKVERIGGKMEAAIACGFQM